MIQFVDVSIAVTDASQGKFLTENTLKAPMVWWPG